MVRNDKEGKRKKKVTEVKIFTVPFVLEDLKENITINTTNYSSDISRQNSIERLSKFTAEKIVAEIEVLGVD